MLAHAETLLDTWLSSVGEEEAAREFDFLWPEGGGEDSLGLQVYWLLRRSLRDPDTRDAALSVLRALSCNGHPIWEFIVLDVADREFDSAPDALSDIVAEPVTRSTNVLASRTSHRVQRLMTNAFPRWTEVQRQSVRGRLAALAHDTPGERTPGIVKYYALAYIPVEFRDDEVNAALAALAAEGGFEEPSGPPVIDDDGCAYSVGAVLDRPVDFAAALDDIPGLVATLGDLPHVGDGPSSVFSTSAFERALEARPELIFPLARELGASDAEIDELYIDALAWAARKAEVGAEVALDLAGALDSRATSKSRAHLADAMAKSFPDLPESRTTEAVELLCSWTQPGVVPDPTLERARDLMASEHAGDFANAGLNTSRGSIGVSLVMAARHLSGDLLQQAHGALERLILEDHAPVRAVVLLWLGNLLSEASYPWLVSVLERAAADGDPRVLQHSGSILRVLRLEEVERFAVSIVRALLRSEGENARKGAGSLIAQWSLRYGTEQLVDMADGVLAGRDEAAKLEAVRVFSYNLLSENERIRNACEARALEILRSQPTVVREAVVHGIPSGPEAAGSIPPVAVLSRAAEDPEFSVVRPLWFHVYRRKGAKSHSSAEAIGAIVRGLLRNPSEATQRAFLMSEGRYLLGDGYAILREAGEEDLAMSLLDCACYHCIPAAKHLLDDLASELAGE